MKILGFGIDLEQMNRFDSRVSKIDDYLIRRFLTEKEFSEYKTITNQNGRVRFLCSHWTAKEAVYKALKVDNRPLGKIEISRLPNGHLVFAPPHLDVEGLLSLTYSEGYCAAACLLVEKLAPPVTHDVSLNTTNQALAAAEDQFVIEKLVNVVSSLSESAGVQIKQLVADVADLKTNYAPKYKDNLSEKIYNRTQNSEPKEHTKTTAGSLPNSQAVADKQHNWQIAEPNLFQPSSSNHPILNQDLLKVKFAQSKKPTHFSKKNKSHLSELRKK